MEETWELAVVSEPSFSDWSGRHTRLRFQTVLASLMFFLVLIYGVGAVSVPGFLKLQVVPSKEKVAISLLCFAIYSLISFFFQHRLENRSLPITSKNSRELPKKLADAYNWVGDEENDFEGLCELIAPSSRSLGNVRGAQVIGGGNNTHDFYTLLSNFKGMRKDLASENYLSDELIRMIPELSLIHISEPTRPY